MLRLSLEQIYATCHLTLHQQFNAPSPSRALNMVRILSWPLPLGRQQSLLGALFPAFPEQHMTQTTRKAKPSVPLAAFLPPWPNCYQLSSYPVLSSASLPAFWFTCASLFSDISFPYLTHPQTSSALPLQPPHLSGEQKSTHCNSSSGNSISSRCDRKHM